MDEELRKFVENNIQDNKEQVLVECKKFIKLQNDKSCIYYFLVNLTSIRNVPYVLISNLLNTLMEIREVKDIVLEKGLEEFTTLMNHVHNEHEHDKIQQMFDDLKNGKFQEFTDQFRVYIDNYLRESKKAPVFWSKIDTKMVNADYASIENATFGNNCYFLDVLFNNWNDPSRKTPMLYDLWNCLSEAYTQIAKNYLPKNGTVDFYFPIKCDLYEGIGDLFSNTEIFSIIENLEFKGMNVHAVSKKGNEKFFLDLNVVRKIYKNEKERKLIDIFKEQLAKGLKVNSKQIKLADSSNFYDKPYGHMIS